MDVEKIINQLSLQDKIELLCGIDAWCTKPLYQHNIPSIRFSDGPYGLRKSLLTKNKYNDQPATCFPTSSNIANTWNVGLVETVGEIIGEESANNGVNVVLGPAINIKRSPLCGRNFEYFSEDPFLAGKLASAMIKGIQKNGTGACVKHFACNNQEHRRMVCNSVVDKRALHELYLTPFEIAVKEANPKCLMTSYNMINGEKASQNSLIKQVLRSDWNYDGVVLSDWGGVIDNYKALLSGSDLEMPYSSYQKAEFFEQVKNNPDALPYLNNSVRRILNLVQETSKGGKRGEGSINYDYNNSVAEKCAEESIVLLKNNNALPLNQYDTVVLFGDLVFNPTIQGGGSARVVPIKKETQECLKNCGINFAATEKAYNLGNKKYKNLSKNIEGLKQLSKTAVLFVGQPDYKEAEGLDRVDIELDEQQISAYKSIRANFSKVIVVLVCGGPVNVTPFNDCDALLYVGYLGQCFLEPITKVLSGKINPSGKLTETFPLSLNDIPCANCFGGDFDLLYLESIFVGYRYYEKTKTPVAYPFGHGLSYTKFTYSNAKVDKNKVTFTLKNIGDKDGAEVCQLYVSKTESQLYKPIKELKGFTKVFLRAGEQKNVTIPFDDKTFRFYNSQSNCYEQEAGSYKIFVASSSDDIRLSVTILLNGSGKLNAINDIPSYLSGEIRNVKLDEFEKIYGDKITVNNYNFYRKNRIVVTDDNTFFDLVYAKGIIGRIIGRGLKRKKKHLLKVKDYKKLSLFYMENNTPFKTYFRFKNFTQSKSQGFIDVLNGKLIKGLSLYFKKSK